MSAIKINARECSVKKIDKKLAKEFLDINHKQGNANSKICYGLYYNGELVQLMSFGKPRFNKNYQWEIIRDCTKKGYLVRGGVSKLWKHFLSENSCHSCICYSYPHDNTFVDKYIDNCGFVNLHKTKLAKNVFFEGEWNGELKRYSKAILERHGVDRLLNGSFGNDRTNEEIITSLGFKKIIEDGLSPQVDSYYPFSVVYRIDDLTDGTFYIGMCEVEKKWNYGYMGSGTKWTKHLSKHPDKAQPENINNEEAHYYKRTIIKSNFKTPKETRDFEIQEIEKYLKEDEKNGKVTSSNNKCFNLTVRPQPLKYENGNICPECGGKNGNHLKTCSKYSTTICEKCGGKKGRHYKGCPDYKDYGTCPDCGCSLMFKRHKPGCKYLDEKKDKLRSCPECGGKMGRHKKTCSKYAELEKCPECGLAYSQHKVTCSHYTGSEIICPECGGRLGSHKKTCSMRKQPKPCPECGAIVGHKSGCSKSKSEPGCTCGTPIGGFHKKSCPLYKEPEKCPECGKASGRHAKTCSHYKNTERVFNVCPECGAKVGHKLGCSHRKKENPCPECGSIRVHKAWCSHRKEPKVCEECGGIGGRHYKTCSHYVQIDRTNIICPECGGKQSKHKKTCSKYEHKVCPVCGSIDGHVRGCPNSSKYKHNPSKFDNICPECGFHSGYHSSNCSKASKTPDRVCKYCGGINGEHKDNCKARSIKCPECGKTRGHHAITCSHCKICPICGGIDGRHRAHCETVNKI